MNKLNKWKYRSMKIACAFIMALSILPGATYLLACEEEEQSVEPPVVEEPSCPVPEKPCEPPVEEEPAEEPPVVEEPEPKPEPEPPVVEEPPINEEPIIEDNVEVNDEVINNTEVNIENNNANQNNIEFNPDINITVEQQQQQQQKQEQQLKKDNPVAYLKQKSKQVTQKETVKVVKETATQNTVPAHVDPVAYANGKGPLDEDYVENPETGEEDILLACGAGITGASALLVIIRKVLIKI